MDLKELG